ncbi:uncharacterized protein LOC111995617 [Quercus suber]|uniref:uncharacterized protein LOC111995617 n=1 Tax=Quercus suber TaxID=58331 RepID=UPI0032DF7483
MENENAEPNFKRMYIRYNAQKVGFLGGCRPFVGLDGCHLKGRFGGQLLSATAKDGNDNIFPVAIAVVEQENQDRPLPAMEILFPIVEHRYCVKHIYNNFNVNHKGMELKSVLWRYAGTTPAREFERGWTILRVDNEREKHVVDLVNRTCGCKAWDLIGIPCNYGIAASFVNREKPEDYTYPCYYKDAYVETYKTPIPPMHSQSEWMSSGQPKPVAPIVYKPPSRPPMKRKRDADEPNLYMVSRANKPMRCGRCQKEWHNARGCKANVTSETPWERRQRLQKGKSVFDVASENWAFDVANENWVFNVVNEN